MTNKNFLLSVFFFVLSLSTLAQAQNLDFELVPVGAYTTSNAINGWTISSQSPTSCVTSTVWSPGSPEFSVIATPILFVFPSPNSIYASHLAMSPLGGNHIAKLNDASATGLRTRIRQTFSVTNATSLFQYAFAGLWEDGGHLCCEQSHLKINFYDSTGLVIPYSRNYTANGTGCPSGAPGFTVVNGWTWTNWQQEWIDLTPFIGSSVTIELVSGDCVFGTHAGTTFFDSNTRAPLVGIPSNGTVSNGTLNPVSFCQGATQAQITAPSGFASYQWYTANSSNIPIPIGSLSGGNTPLLTIQNPTAGVIYTVQMVSVNNFTITQIDTLKYSTVAIEGLGTYSSCPNGASGTAMVQAGGSGTGYNYTWTNSGNTVVSTSSAAVNLPSGMYTVSITAIGSPGCGSPTATVTVGTSPQNVNTIIKPFCGTTLILNAPPGTNRQWYNGTSSITAVQGGTASILTVSSPSTGQFFWLAYLSPQGCRDSLKFLLNQIPPGSMSVTRTSSTCVGSSNGSNTITLIPAFGVPPANSFSVFSTLGPVYSASVTASTINSFVTNGMPAATYSVIASDGACQYTSTFTVNDHIFNFQVLSTTVCVGSTAIIGVSFSTAITPNQYNFAWSPVANIMSGQGNIAILLNPVVTSTVGISVYSVVVTPSIVNCPMTKTVSITSLTLPTPVLSSVPQPFCKNAATQTITAFPPGGTFTSTAGTWLNGATGLITPSITPVGTNTFVYVLSSGNCAASVSGSFSVSQYNTAALTTQSLSVCDNTTSCVNLATVVQNSSGIWSGQGISSGFMFCPLNLNAGPYTLTYNNASTPNATLCPASQTMTITVRASAIQGITTPAPFCNTAAPFNIPITTTGGTWSSPVPFFLSQTGLVNPLTAPGGIVTLTYTGICGNTATVNLTTAIFHSAALTNQVSSLCAGAPTVNLMSMVTSTINGSWSGTNVANNIFTPGLGAGTYTLLYNTTSSNPPMCPDQSLLPITVYGLPTLNIQFKINICNGEKTALTLLGASNYSLNGQQILSAVNLSPTATTSYTITGENFGCLAQKIITVNVNPCTGIEDTRKELLLNIYPNPTSGNLFIELQAYAKIILYNELGQILLEANLNAEKQSLDLDQLPVGLYFLKASFDTNTSLSKIIKTN